MATSQSLLVRLLNSPDLAAIVPRLQPDVLHRVIRTCGLEDCAEFVALATPQQLTRILDADVWHAAAPGADETLDAERFGVWIAVLMDCGAAVAAEKLVALDIELVVAGVARHAAVFDHAAVSPYTTLGGEVVPGRAMNGALVSEIGGYVLEAKRTSAWEAIVELLAFLAAERPAYFQRLMRGCVRLSSGPREADGFHDLLDDDEQDMFDLACDREARRERQGYATPAQAQAFLRGGRDLALDGERPPRSAIARAYFRAVESPGDTDAGTPRDGGGTLPDAAMQTPATVDPAGFVEVLREAGLFTPAPPRALLGAAEGETSRLAMIEGHVAADPAAAEELAYLANALVAGCAIQSRPFTPGEASDAAAAICNLGLENWPAHWFVPDLITAFQVGWTVLHRDACMFAAEALIDTLAGIRCGDRDVQLRLDGLRRELIQHVRTREPWRARQALDVIIMLDAPAWAALLALIAECPVVHAAVSASRRRLRSVNPTDFEFIAQNRQFAAVREFMTSLTATLTR
jgi:uncharacterized protein DUF6178